MPRFVVNPTCSIKHKGKTYTEGKTIELSEKEAEGLHVTPVAQAQHQQSPSGDGGKKEDDGKGDKDKK